MDAASGKKNNIIIPTTANQPTKVEPLKDFQSSMIDLIKAYEQRMRGASTEAPKLHSASQLAELIRTARNQQGLTQKELADLAGISLGTMVGLENGKRTSAFETVERVLKALGMTLWIK